MVDCKFYGNYSSSAAMVKPVSVRMQCYLRNSDGEAARLEMKIGGCPADRTASELLRFDTTYQCLGDGIGSVRLKLCQTRGGPLPDDCTDYKTYTMPDK